MSAWLTAVADVRKVLSDGPTDKLRYRKKVMNQQDGSNKIFKSFEFRRVTDFVTATAPLGVYVNDALVTVSSDDLASGEFELAAAPDNGDRLVATYYIQWFNDDELVEFLVSASQWLGTADQYLNIPIGLRPAAKEYAASIAYQKLISRFSENLAEIYQLYDAPDEKRFNPIEAYARVAKQKMDLAFKLRDDFYARSGQALAPRSGVARGRVRDVPPNV